MDGGSVEAAGEVKGLPTQFNQITLNARSQLEFLIVPSSIPNPIERLIFVSDTFLLSPIVSLHCSVSTNIVLHNNSSNVILSNIFICNTYSPADLQSQFYCVFFYSEPMIPLYSFCLSFHLYHCYCGVYNYLNYFCYDLCVLF